MLPEYIKYMVLTQCSGPFQVCWIFLIDLYSNLSLACQARAKESIYNGWTIKKTTLTEA